MMASGSLGSPRHRDLYQWASNANRSRSSSGKGWEGTIPSLQGWQAGHSLQGVQSVSARLGTAEFDHFTRDNMVCCSDSNKLSSNSSVSFAYSKSQRYHVSHNLPWVCHFAFLKIKIFFSCFSRNKKVYVRTKGYSLHLIWTIIKNSLHLIYFFTLLTNKKLILFVLFSKKILYHYNTDFFSALILWFIMTLVVRKRLSK